MLAKISVAGLKRRCDNIFVLKCESLHSVGKSLGFLDLSVQVNVPNLLITALQEKFTKPLSPSSAHAPYEHSSWPRAVAKRVHTLSGGSSLAMSTSAFCILQSLGKVQHSMSGLTNIETPNRARRCECTRAWICTSNVPLAGVTAGPRKKMGHGGQALVQGTDRHPEA